MAVQNKFPLNVTFTQGDDHPFELAFYENDDVTPISMDGKLMSLTVKPVYDDDDTDAAAYIALNTADMTVDEDTEVAGGGVNNRVSMVFPRTLTALIPVGDHVVDFQVLDGGYLHTQGSGTAVCEPQTGRRIPT